MITEILMEALINMDDETLDYVLESCDTEEIEIIQNVLEATAASPEANSVLRAKQNAKNKAVAKDARLERLATLIISARSRDNGTTRNTDKHLKKYENEFIKTANKYADIMETNPRSVIEKYLRAGAVNTKETLSRNSNPIIAARAAKYTNMAVNEEMRHIRGKLSY